VQKISQGSVVTRVKHGAIFSDDLITNMLKNQRCKMQIGKVIGNSTVASCWLSMTNCVLLHHPIHYSYTAYC